MNRERSTPTPPNYWRPVLIALGLLTFLFSVLLLVFIIVKQPTEPVTLQPTSIPEPPTRTPTQVPSPTPTTLPTLAPTPNPTPES